MIKQSNNRLMTADERSNLRVKENKRVAWFVQNSDQKGFGHIRNISTTGMLFETDEIVDLKQSRVISFFSDMGQENFVPQRGKLIWSKPKIKSKNNYLCGVEFVEPKEYVLPKLRKRIEKHIGRVNRMRYANIIFDWVMFCAIIALTGYALWMSLSVYQDMRAANMQLEQVVTKQTELTGAYRSMYETSQTELFVTKTNLVEVQTELTKVQAELNETRKLYNESESILASVNKELESTKIVLKETELMLSNALKGKSEISGLSEQKQKEFKTKSLELSSTIIQIQDENNRLKSMMRKLEAQLKYYEGDVNNMEEGKALIATYKRNMKLVKGKIREYKNESKKIKKEAFKERDALQGILGNNGYFMKEGQTVIVDEEKYITAGSANSSIIENNDQKGQAGKKRKVDVNIEFVK